MKFGLFRSVNSYYVNPVYLNPVNITCGLVAILIHFLILPVEHENSLSFVAVISLDRKQSCREFSADSRDKKWIKG